MSVRPIGLAPVVALLIVTLVIPATSSTAFAVDLETLREIEFRTSFGLLANPEHVRAVASDPSTYNKEWGIHLTVQEAAEMARRMFLQENLDGLLALGKDRADIFGGLWIDQAAGGVIDVALTQDTPANRAKFVTAAPAGADLRFRVSARTIAQLDAVHEQVVQDRELLRAEGVHVISVGTDLTTNKVEIGVTDPIGAQSILAARYESDAIDVIQGERPKASACPTRENCSNPLKGGLTIVGPLACTSAFIGKKANGNYFMYTAGHCGSAGSNWTHNGVGIGQMFAEVYQDNSSSDAGIIDIPNALKSNLVMGAEGAAFGYTAITSKKALGVSVGTGLCKSGKTSDFDCGTITDNDVDIEYTDGTFMQNQIRMTIQTGLGDSGGPVWINSRAYGIWSAQFSANDGLYTQIAAAESNLAAPIYFGP